VVVRPLADVPSLREAIVKHHLEEWPNSAGRLDPNKWGHLGDPAIEPARDCVPITMVATTPEGSYVGQGSIIARDLDHRLYRDMGPWMGGLCVLEHLRGNKIGRLLHFERLRIAAELGIEDLFLFTEARPYKTVELYREFGWQVECEIPDFDDGSTTERRWVMTVHPRDVI
jgi:GNAT superfamily N-acetyltransferase